MDGDGGGVVGGGGWGTVVLQHVLTCVCEKNAAALQSSVFVRTVRLLSPEEFLC